MNFVFGGLYGYGGGKENRISIFFEKFINIFKVTVCAGSVPGMVSGISVFQVNFKIGGKKL